MEFVADLLVEDGADADADADVDVDAATCLLACSAQGGSPFSSNSAHWKKEQLCT